jgi:hypothetical protein
MKMIIKGDLALLSRYDVIQNIYIYLDPALKKLYSLEFEDDKRQIEFDLKEILLGYILKIVENNKLKTLTLIIKNS